MGLIVKCSNCNHSQDYTPHLGGAVNYYYKGINNTKFPQIDSAWCCDCNKFVPVQLAISNSEVNKYKDNLSTELSRLRKKIFKTRNIKQKIDFLSHEINDISILISLTNNQSTKTTCLQCNGDNIVFKNVKDGIWHCPKCKIGKLKVVKEEDDILFRPGEKTIYPQPISKIDISQIVLKVIDCSNNIILNENVYHRISGNYNIIRTISDKYTISFVDRIALVYSVITKMLKIKIDKVVFTQIITRTLISFKFITEDIKENIFQRLNESIKFFSDEIDVELKCSFFLPTAIINILRNPDLMPSHEITGIDPIESLKHWGIISDTISAFFISKKTKF